MERKHNVAVKADDSLDCTLLFNFREKLSFTSVAGQRNLQESVELFAHVFQMCHIIILS